MSIDNPDNAVRTTAFNGRTFNLYFDDSLPFVNMKPEDGKVQQFLQYAAKACFEVNEKIVGEKGAKPENYKQRQSDEDINVMILSLMEGQKIAMGGKPKPPLKVCEAVASLFQRQFDKLPSMRKDVLLEIAFVGFANGLLWSQKVGGLTVEDGKRNAYTDIEEEKKKFPDDKLGKDIRGKLVEFGFPDKDIKRLNQVFLNEYKYLSGKNTDILLPGKQLFNMTHPEGVRSQVLKDGQRAAIFLGKTRPKTSRTRVLIETYNKKRHDLPEVHKSDIKNLFCHIAAFKLINDKNKRNIFGKSRLLSKRPCLSDLLKASVKMNHSQIDDFTTRMQDRSIHVHNSVRHHEERHKELELFNTKMTESWQEFKKIGPEYAKIDLISSNNLENTANGDFYLGL